MGSGEGGKGTVYRGRCSHSDLLKFCRFFFVFSMRLGWWALRKMRPISETGLSNGED